MNKNNTKNMISLEKNRPIIVTLNETQDIEYIDLQNLDSNRFIESNNCKNHKVIFTNDADCCTFINLASQLNCEITVVIVNFYAENTLITSNLNTNINIIGIVGPEFEASSKTRSFLKKLNAMTYVINTNVTPYSTEFSSLIETLLSDIQSGYQFETEIEYVRAFFTYHKLLNEYNKVKMQQKLTERNFKAILKLKEE